MDSCCECDYAMERIRNLYESDEERKLSRLRKIIVEVLFGQGKTIH
jgi:hypothetical protein